jgi:hydroxypyruvate isomerase
MTRRAMLGSAALGAVAAACPGAGAADEPPTARRGRIRQSLASWCLATVGWSVDEMIAAARALGCPSVELVDPPDWPKLEAAGLTCAIALNGMPGAPFIKGLNNRAYRDEVVGRTKGMIDACAGSNGICRQVIAFTGYVYRDVDDPAKGTISREEGFESCVTGLRMLGEHAGKAGVTISLEQLNTRDDTHEMKGHPGYQGDDIDWVADIIKAVDLPSVKLLFDVYHVQIMNGDIVRRIHQYKDLISHVHTAGNPGRGELHLDQEIDYAPVMKALLAIGYEGYVGQEFIPTGDPMTGLREAVRICDV